MEETTSGSKSSMSKFGALSQFVHDYLIELGLTDQAQLLKDFARGEASPGAQRIDGHPVAHYWDLKLTGAAKATPIIVSRAVIGPRLTPSNPSPPNLDQNRELDLKIKVLNQLVYEYLKAMDVSTIADDFKGRVQDVEELKLNFSQLPLLHSWLDIVDEISFLNAPWGELGPILPDFIPLPRLDDVGLEWEFGAPHPNSGDIGVDDYIESPDSQSKADVPSTSHPSSFPDA